MNAVRQEIALQNAQELMNVGTPLKARADCSHSMLSEIYRTVLRKVYNQARKLVVEVGGGMYSVVVSKFLKFLMLLLRHASPTV